MARTKGGPKAMKRRRNILSQVKGYRFARSKKKKAALEAIKHAGKYAFADRRAKKRTMRGLHIIKINAALRANGFKNYATFIDAMKKKGVTLNRLVLSQIAETRPEVFARIIAQVVS
ncbi:MAG: 50S ribosomal protein L20 [Patescibacteria group bacterium]|jgi:large subunit ribosomal protein L20